LAGEVGALRSAERDEGCHCGWSERLAPMTASAASLALTLMQIRTAEGRQFQFD
jgi:hypothetical protein